MDHGGALRHDIDIAPLDNELIFDAVRTVARDVSMHLDLPDALLAEEVADLAALLIVGAGDIDGKMSIYKAELVAEATSDAGNKVLQDGADSVDLGNVLPVSVPDINAQLAVLDLAHVSVDVTEQALQLAAGTLHYEVPRLHRDLNYNRKGTQNRGQPSQKMSNQ